MRDVTSVFVCASVPTPLARRILLAGHELVRIEPPHSGPSSGRVLPESAQELDAQRVRAALGDRPVAWVVLDHYELSASWSRAARAFAPRILVIDDLANREHDGDVLLDQTLGRDAQDYAGIVRERCRLILGPRHALLRPEFLQARPDALRRRRVPGPVQRLLLSLGATDVGGVTLPALEAVLDAQVDASVDVVLGSGAASLPHVQRIAADDPKVVVHVDRRNMATLMAGADLAVGAAGTSSWERCCLALPTVTLVLADNQRLVAAGLVEAGAAVAVGRTADLAAVVRRVADDATARAEMAAAAAAVTDGAGAASLAELMLDVAQPQRPAAGFRLRPADAEDIERLWLWRNDQHTRAMATSHRVVVWASHQAWFARTLADPRARVLIVEVDDEPAAMVRFDDLDDSRSLVSINVAPSARGGGVGRSALALACFDQDRERPGTQLVAEILTANAASRRIFEANGFCEEPPTDLEPRRFVRRPGDDTDF